MIISGHSSPNVSGTANAQQQQQPSASDEVACVPETGWNRSIWNPHVFEGAAVVAAADSGSIGNAGAIGAAAMRCVSPQEEVLRQQAVAVVFSRFQVRVYFFFCLYEYTFLVSCSLFGSRDLAGGGESLFVCLFVFLGGGKRARKEKGKGRGILLWKVTGLQKSPHACCAFFRKYAVCLGFERESAESGWKPYSSLVVRSACHIFCTCSLKRIHR